MIAVALLCPHPRKMVNTMVDLVTCFLYCSSVNFRSFSSSPVMFSFSFFPELMSIKDRYLFNYRYEQNLFKTTSSMGFCQQVYYNIWSAQAADLLNSYQDRTIIYPFVRDAN